MSTLLLFNKPCGVLCQFSEDGSGKPTLKRYIDVPGVYPAGRLDTDSEGLLALTDDGALQARLSSPRHKLPKTYWVQCEGVPTEQAIEELKRGVRLKDGPTLPAQVRPLEEPELWPRVPPIRFRKNSPTGWLEIVLREGRNRQVRRMTAAVGFPTLRLVRAGIGPFTLEGLESGAWRRASPAELSPFVAPAHKEAKPPTSRRTRAPRMPASAPKRGKRG